MSQQSAAIRPTWSRLAVAAGILMLVVASAAGGWALANARHGGAVFDGVGYQSRAAASIARVQSMKQLIADANLIVVGEILPQVVVPEADDFGGGDYMMTVEVREVLKGAVEGDSPIITVARYGMAPNSGVAHGVDDLAGPMGPGTAILALVPSAAPGIWEILGHTQGELRVKDGRIASKAGVTALNDYQGKRLGEAVREIKRQAGD